MYPRNGRLGQEDYEEYPPGYEEPEASWWEKIWSPVEKVLTVGTETFKQVAPYTLEPKGATPAYYPGVSKLPTSPGATPYPNGYDPSSPYIILPGGQVVRRPAPAQPTNMMMPLAIGFGAILLFTTMGKKRKR